MHDWKMLRYYADEGHIRTYLELKRREPDSGWKVWQSIISMRTGYSFHWSQKKRSHELQWGWICSFCNCPTRSTARCTHFYKYISHFAGSRPGSIHVYKQIDCNAEYALAEALTVQFLQPHLQATVMKGLAGNQLKCIHFAWPSSATHQKALTWLSQALRCCCIVMK